MYYTENAHQLLLNKLRFDLYHDLTRSVVMIRLLQLHNSMQLVQKMQSI